MTDVDRAIGGPRPAVIAPGDGVWEEWPDGAGKSSVRIDLEGVGAPHLVQRLLHINRGGEFVHYHPHSEDVLYVVEGTGEAIHDDRRVSLRPGVGFMIAAGVQCHIDAKDDLHIVSVLAPPPGRPDALEPSSETSRDQRPWVHESEEEIIAAGDDPARDRLDRYFKLMIDPGRGAHYVTQFIGFIERSKASPHTHTYDEVIFITGGEGIVHIGDDAHPIGEGHSVYLPPGTLHCLENPEDEPLSLLGVFCPAGSPRARDHA